MPIAGGTGLSWKQHPYSIFLTRAGGILLEALCKCDQVPLLLWIEKWHGLMATLQRLHRPVNHATSAPLLGREPNVPLAGV